VLKRITEKVKSRLRHYKGRILSQSKKIIHPFITRMYHSLQSNPYNIAADYRLSCLQNGLAYRFIPKIAFYLSMISHIDHYKRIWRHINKENFVVLVPSNNPSLTTQREYTAILNFLSAEYA
jgi:hypothetical protein